jgi:hypothetical protein
MVPPKYKIQQNNMNIEDTVCLSLYMRDNSKICATSNMPLASALAELKSSAQSSTIINHVW